MKAINVLLTNNEEKIKTWPLQQTSGFKASLIVMQQGHQIPPHTSQTDAMVLVLEGKIAFMLNEEITILENGDVFNFKANEIHALQALETARFVLIK
jgi:quercetin dioxygenase-like cupin family protein